MHSQKRGNLVDADPASAAAADPTSAAVRAAAADFASAAVRAAAADSASAAVRVAAADSASSIVRAAAANPAAAAVRAAAAAKPAAVAVRAATADRAAAADPAAAVRVAIAASPHPQLFRTGAIGQSQGFFLPSGDRKVFHPGDAGQGLSEAAASQNLHAKHHKKALPLPPPLLNLTPISHFSLFWIRGC